MTIFDYLNQLEFDDPNEPDFSPDITELAKQIHKFSDFNKINQSKLDRVNKFIDEQVFLARENFQREYRQKRILQTRALVYKHLKYNHPKLINFDQLEQNGKFDRMWVLPIFLPPGKVDFFIRSMDMSDQNNIHSLQDSGKFEFFHSRHIVQVREERTPFFAKTLKTNEKTCKFLKEGSVFVDWLEETPQQEALALRHDLQLMKLSKIIADYDVQEEVKQVIRSHFRRLRCIFIAVCIEGGNPPDMGKRQFIRFC